MPHQIQCSPPKMCLVLSRFVLTARIHIFVGHFLCVVLTNQTAQNWTIINRAAIGGIRRLLILFFSTLLDLGPVFAAISLTRSRSRTCLEPSPPILAWCNTPNPSPTPSSRPSRVSGSFRFGFETTLERLYTADAPIGSSWRRINEVALCP
jgi:hypothetical protein